VLPVIQRIAQEYLAENGQAPCRDWLVGLKDTKAQTKVTKAVTQMEAENFGDHKPITGGNGLHKRRINYGSSYRIYYITEGAELIILFTSSDKSDQQAVIDTSKEYLTVYRARKPNTAFSNTKRRAYPQNKGNAKK